ncbi:MAG: hypothetical protein Q4D14_01840 [Bacteroidales bacterium]|nr:hypothetical protein [Bacteroidales bacterium]
MTYRFTIKSSENDMFLREIRIDSTASFLELNNAILDTVKYTHDEITSFFTVTDKDEDYELWLEWNQEEEITIMDMGLSSDRDSYVMDKTYLDEFIHEEHQRLVFVFEQLTERAFYVELAEILFGEDIDKPICTKKKGEAPQQHSTLSKEIATNTSTMFGDDDLYGSNEFNEDELDIEGFEFTDGEEQ